MMQMLPVRRLCVAFATRSLFMAGIIWSCQALAQGMPENQLMFELLNRIEQLEREIRQLRGDLEMYRYRQENFNRRLQGLESNISNPGGAPNTSSSSQYPSSPGTQQISPYGAESGFVTQPRGSAGIAPDASQQPSSPNRSATLNKDLGSSSLSEQATYDAAIDRLREGNYQEAIEGFQQFLRRYPTNPLAGNAQYWLGEAYYVNRDFAKSRQAFIAMGTNYPDSNRLPDAMLKLGYVYEALDEKAKARQVLQKLVQAYPETQAASLAESRLQSLR
jgi:tol-pal system protein YbgF